MMEQKDLNQSSKDILVSILGSVVDAYFPRKIPALHNLLKAGDNWRTVIEVITHLNSNTVRGIALIPTQGLSRLKHPNLGATLPSGPAAQSFVLEVILTFFLMLVILSVSTGAREKGIMAGAAMGAVVGLEALFAGPISGAFMNPARSLAPALVSGRIDNLWVYLLAPVAGSYLGVIGCACVQKSGCCTTQQKKVSTSNGGSNE